MGAFDDALQKAVPGGNLATPIAVAVGALLLGRFFGGSSTPAPAQAPATPAPLPTNVPAGSLIGGLSDLIGKLTAGGVGPQVNSWVGHGANEPIQPGQLGGALGQSTLNELSPADRHEPAGIAGRTGGCAAAADQPADAQRPGADGGRPRKITGLEKAGRASRVLPLIRRRDGAARRPCRAPGSDPRSDPRRLPGPPTIGAVPD